ncbi:adenosine receptor A2b-like [Asterias amurensis]|uniref:adenosine receptor A2b-like n=1 Tax=Asterias amurensis TaxID=7602 RepID=UPI003AB81944
MEAKLQKFLHIGKAYKFSSSKERSPSPEKCCVQSMRSESLCSTETHAVLNHAQCIENSAPHNSNRREVMQVAVCSESHLTESFIGREIYCRTVKSGFIGILTAYSSSYALCLVTYERYIGIVHPLHYPRMMSAKNVIWIIFIALGMSFLFSSPRLFTWNASNDNSTLGCEVSDSFNSLVDVSSVLFFLFAYLLPILFMSWVYYKIQATLKRSAQQLQQQNVQGAAFELLQVRQNVISMLRIVMGALVVLWTPLTFSLIICLPHAMQKWCSTSSVTLPIVFPLMYNMNSVINPIIYIFKYKKFRKGLQDKLCCSIGGHLRQNRIGDQIAMNEGNAVDEQQETSITSNHAP